MQNDKLTYYNLVEIVYEKRKSLENWSYLSTSTVGSALFDYIQSASQDEESYGCFELTSGDRPKVFKNCSEHVNRLLIQLDRRFVRSKFQESFSILFNPQCLMKNKKNLIRNEWESFKQPFSDFVNSFSTNQCTKTFWKDFIAFLNEYKNLLLLLSIYLISPANSAECETSVCEMLNMLFL